MYIWSLLEEDEAFFLNFLSSTPTSKVPEFQLLTTYKFIFLLITQIYLDITIQVHYICLSEILGIRKSTEPQGGKNYL